MKALPIVLVLVLIAGTAGALPNEGLGIDYLLELESTASLGSVALLAQVRPMDAGADALLTSDDLSSLSGDPSPQTTFVNRASLQLVFGWRSTDSLLELITTTELLQSPGGYRDPWDGIVAPGVTALRVTRLPRNWDGPITTVSAGRFPVADAGRFIVDQLADGAAFEVLFPRLSVSAALASTRWVDKYVYSARLTPDDAAGFATSDEYFAPVRLIGLAEFEYRELVGQTLRFSIATYDDRLASPGMDRSYLAVGVGGGLYAGLAHQTIVALQTVSASGTTDASFAGLSGTELRYRFDSIPLEAFGDLYYATGGSTPFLSVSPIVVSQPLGLVLSDLLAVGVGIDTTFDRLVPAFHTRIFLQPLGSQPWVGIESVASLSFALLSDFSLRGSVGASQSALGWLPFLELSGRITL